MLAKETGVKLHLCHCSTADSVKMIALAKEAGLPVTGEVCPHHFILTSDDIKEDDGNYKMNPPLRSKADVEGFEGRVKKRNHGCDFYRPRPTCERREKSLYFTGGIRNCPGLETSAALTYTELVKTGYLSVMDMAEKMSYNPAKVLGLEDKGSVSEGMTADLVIFDPDKQYKIDKSTFASKGKNTPFDGYEVCGEVAYTLVDGKIVYDRNK